MDIQRKIRNTRNLTPTEQQLGRSILAMGEDVQGLSIKELSAKTNTSVASIHRFCKKVGLEGFKELKVELARSHERSAGASDIDINFPFEPNTPASEILPRISTLYKTTLDETRKLLDINEVNRAAELIAKADVVDLYTCSHNLYPAKMFRDRLLSAGKLATCHEGSEQKVRSALASGPTHVAIAISYSGLSMDFRSVLPLISSTKTPVIMVGTPYCAQLHPGFAAYLLVSDQESFTHRIAQFASHIAVQYVLDALFSCYFARDYDNCAAMLEASLPYTRLPGAN